MTRPEQQDLWASGVPYEAYVGRWSRVLPWLAQASPKLAAGNGPSAFFVYFLISEILFAAGGIILGIQTFRASILPRVAGLLLVIGVVLNLIGGLFLTGAIGAIVTIVSFILWPVGLGWMGYVLTQAGVVNSIPVSTK